MASGECQCGRWLSPDPLGGDIANPQSLNRYAYVLNNPTTFTDPSGLGPCNEFNTSYEGSGLPFPCNNCPSSGACGTSNNPSGLAPVTIDSNGDPLSADISEGEGQYVQDNCLNCVNVEGNFYGQHVNTTFPSWDAYANWSTSLPLLPQNQIYDAFWSLLENQGWDPSKTYQVQVYMWGLLPNVATGLGPQNTANATAGSISDPYKGTHPGGSYISLWPPVDTPHCASGPLGATCHNDKLSSIWLFPFHEIFDYLPSLFVNPQNPNASPKGVVPWTYSGFGGCHP